MVDKAFKKAYEKTKALFDRVEQGQSEDAPVELPGTFKERSADDPQRVVHKPPERTSEPENAVRDPTDPTN